MPELSVAVGAVQDTVPVANPLSVLPDWVLGHPLITGLSISIIIRRETNLKKDHISVLLALHSYTTKAIYILSMSCWVDYNYLYQFSSTRNSTGSTQWVRNVTI